MLQRLTVLACTLACVFAAGSTLAGAQTPPGRDAGQSLDARAEHRRVVDFWTPERRAAAVPADITRATPNKGRPGGGGGGGGTGAVTGATWTGGGDVARTTGRVFFQSGNSLYSCSGSAVQSNAGSLVVTAGHCVNSGNHGSFYVTNWIFYPGYNNGPDQTLGGWTATDLFTTTTWANTANGFADDMGLAAVVGNTPGKTLAQALAPSHLPTIAFSLSPVGGTYTAFGYPAEQRFNGMTLTYCQGPVTVGLDGESSLAFGCNMNGGSSGGPWFRAPFVNGSTNTINSVASYGYNSLKGYLFGPIFDGGEAAAFNGANTSSPDCPTSPSGYVCVDISN
jgi:hypothetical protein